MSVNKWKDTNVYGAFQNKTYYASNGTTLIENASAIFDGDVTIHGNINGDNDKIFSCGNLSSRNSSNYCQLYNATMTYNSLSYMIQQAETGETHINSASGTNLYFKINDSISFYISPDSKINFNYDMMCNYGHFTDIHTTSITSTDGYYADLQSTGAVSSVYHYSTESHTQALTSVDINTTTLEVVTINVEDTTSTTFKPQNGALNTIDCIGGNVIYNQGSSVVLTTNINYNMVLNTNTFQVGSPSGVISGVTISPYGSYMFVLSALFTCTTSSVDTVTLSGLQVCLTDGGSQNFKTSNLCISKTYSGTNTNTEVSTMQVTGIFNMFNVYGLSTTVTPNVTAFYSKTGNGKINLDTTSNIIISRIG